MFTKSVVIQFSPHPTLARGRFLSHSSALSKAKREQERVQHFSEPNFANSLGGWERLNAEETSSSVKRLTKHWRAVVAFRDEILF